MLVTAFANGCGVSGPLTLTCALFASVPMSSALKTARATRSDAEVECRRGRVLDGVADALDDVREALGGEHAERRGVDTALEHAGVAYGLFGHRERPAVLSIGAARRDTNSMSICGAHTGRHDERIRRVLFERIVRMEAQFLCRWVPDDPVDTAGRAFRTRELQEEDRALGDRCGIDRAVERHRDPRLHVKPIELVQDRPILALRRVARAVGRHRQVPSRVLIGVRYREAVRREWTALRRAEIKERPDERRSSTSCGHGGRVTSKDLAAHAQPTQD
ncbi:hypothetical protein LuPra_01107 [Luteitalea pratensis]|uniref:Uncharacterized protein n=1 Tax=Luteitalea pratensis TaxID=1855912 RepID=A0A143PI34_LUTPR|nr:hypothetical protein [Luteitalea pratensis]AMY07923.1 hypothetical protein LuPra_01107 [Luteitalea pratensis]